MRIYPKTFYGWLSGILIILYFIFMSIFFIFVFLGERGGSGFFSNLKLTIPFLLAVFSGIFSFFSGVVSLAKRDFSVLNIFSSTLGLLIFLWTLGELFFRH